MDIDFLKIKYTSIDFLINRTQFSSSLFLEKEYRIKSALQYLSSITLYNNEYLLVFDFDKYLNTMFRCQSDNKAKLILITDTGKFSAAGKRAMDRLNLKKQSRRFSNRFIAVKVSSETEIVTLPLKELRLVPGCIQKRESDYGILGLRFPAPKRIQYFLDSETMIVNNILKKEGLIKA